MTYHPIVLKIVPSLRASRHPDGRAILTQKFIDGVAEFKRMWSDPIDVYMECSENHYHNLDDVVVSPHELPFRLHLMPLQEVAHAIAADPAAVVLLSLDDWRQSGFSALCRRSGVACAYVSEYSLLTRKQIIDAETSNPLRRARRKLWEAGEERKRRMAVRTATGLQCNGTPTYHDYRGLCSQTLLYFDTRVSASLLASEELIRRRLAQARPGGPLRLLYSGRLAASKGVGHLLEVAKALRQRKVDFHLSICGDGDLKTMLSDQIHALQLTQQVTLKGVLGFKDELVPFAKSNIDLFVCCHPQGDPSCTYLETMSCGVPIAGYANEAFEGIVKHSGCGWTAPVNQPDALADRIAEVSRTPQSLLAMSLSSLVFAKDHTFDQTFARRIHHLGVLAECALVKT